MIIADGDGESAVVGPDDVQEEALLALDLELGGFTGVGREVVTLICPLGTAENGTGVVQGRHRRRRGRH